MFNGPKGLFNILLYMLNNLGRFTMRELLSNKEAFETATSKLVTKDGLLPCSSMNIHRNRNGYQLELLNTRVPVFPVAFNAVTTDYLASNNELWNQAATRVTYYPTICGGEPVFGVPFKQAVDIALQNGNMRSKFFFPKRVEGNRYETLLLQLDRRRGNDNTELVQLQVWQYSPGTHRAHYLHALSPDFNKYLCHIDGAVIEYAEDDLDLFLKKSKKVKGDSYEKYFRIDGQIDVKHMHNLAKAFFPTEELYDEAFEIVSTADTQA